MSKIEVGQYTIHSEEHCVTIIDNDAIEDKLGNEAKLLSGDFELAIKALLAAHITGQLRGEA